MLTGPGIVRAKVPVAPLARNTTKQHLKLPCPRVYSVHLVDALWKRLLQVELGKHILGQPRLLDNVLVRAQR